MHYTYIHTYININNNRQFPLPHQSALLEYSIQLATASADDQVCLGAGLVYFLGIYSPSIQVDDSSPFTGPILKTTQYIQPHGIRQVYLLIGWLRACTDDH